MWTRITNAILTSKWNKPFPVTLIPSAIGLYLADRQGERQRQILTEIRALGEGDREKVRAIEENPVGAFGKGVGSEGVGR